MNLSREEIVRYQRHLSLAGFGPSAQEKLKAGSVLVVGAGGLGCPALLYLAAAGIGRIEVVDGDQVDLSNLQRQVLYTEGDAGRPKADAAVERLGALTRLIRLVSHPFRMTRENAMDLVRGVDVVLDGSDNFATRYLVNDACVLADRPLVYGAIQGFEGQASVFNWRGGPTYRCLFPEPPERGTVPNCAEAGVLGVLPGLIGTVQALEVIKLLTGVGEPLSGRLLLWDALTMAVRTVKILPEPSSRRITELPPDGYGETCAVPEDSGRASRRMAVNPQARRVASGASGPESPFVASGGDAASLPAEIDVPGFETLLRREAPLQVIDVRDHWERALGSIEPSVQVPLAELERATADLATLDPGKPTVVYCAVGMRSLRGAELLRARHGFRNVASLRGGIKAWASSRERT